MSIFNTLLAFNQKANGSIEKILCTPQNGHAMVAGMKMLNNGEMFKVLALNIS